MASSPAGAASITGFTRWQTSRPTRRDRVVTKAVQRAVRGLGLTDGQAAQALGLTERQINLLHSGRRYLRAESKAGEIALMIVRIYRAVDALVGSDEATRRRWMANHHQELQCSPQQTITTVVALVNTLDCLEGGP